MKKEDFGIRLKKALAIKNIKQIELANKLNIHRATINNYIKDKYEPNRERLDDIAKILDISPAWLLGYDVPMERESNSSTPPAPKTINDIDFTGIERIAAEHRGENFTQEELKFIQDTIDFVVAKKQKLNKKDGQPND